MMTSKRSLALLAVAALVAAAQAKGDSYTVILVNGARIESRYEPRPAPDDPDKLLLLTEMGNQISLDRRHVREIRGAAESPGFDREIDTRPRFVGIAPNDKPVADPPGGTAGAPATWTVLDHLVQQSLDAIEQRLLAARANTVRQFAEPPVAGQSKGTGLPLTVGSAPRRDPYLLRLQGMPPPFDLRLQGLLPPSSTALQGLAGAPPSAFVASPAGASAPSAPGGGS